MNFEWESMISDWQSPELRFSLALLALWALFWKGMALWRSAKEDSKPWFVVLLVLNTLGILELVYLFFFAKKKLFVARPASVTSPAPKPRSKRQSK